MNHFGKNVVIVGALLAAGFLIAWLRFRPYLGSEALDAGLGQLGYIGGDPDSPSALSIARPLDPAGERALDLETLGCPQQAAGSGSSP